MCMHSPRPVPPAARFMAVCALVKCGWVSGNATSRAGRNERMGSAWGACQASTTDPQPGLPYPPGPEEHSGHMQRQAGPRVGCPCSNPRTAPLGVNALKWPEIGRAFFRVASAGHRAGVPHLSGYEGQSRWGFSESHEK